MGLFKQIVKKVGEDVVPNEGKQFLDELKMMVRQLDFPKDYNLKFNSQQLEELKRLVVHMNDAIQHIEPDENNNSIVSGLLNEFLD